jgi:hypothetical protein
MAAQAKADGFRCSTVEGDLDVTVYNHLSAEEGTRTAAVMVLSDPSVSSGRKTIAKFTDAKGTLSSQGASYAADVDLRYADSRRAGEYLLGTRLGELDQIKVNVGFTFGDDLEDGEEVSGKLIAYRRDGDRIVADLDCVRYLKN